MTSRHEAYRAFVESSAQTDDGYLFETPRCRFSLEPNDELVAPSGARVVRVEKGGAVELPGGARLPIVGLELDKLQKAFAALPCRYSRLVLDQARR
jgi:hypothetical protein